MRTVIDEVLVEWDDNKNIINIQKHGISFETAALVFADEERIEYYDKIHSVNEDRYVVPDVYRELFMLFIPCVGKLQD